MLADSDAVDFTKVLNTPTGPARVSLPDGSEISVYTPRTDHRGCPLIDDRSDRNVLCTYNNKVLWQIESAPCEKGGTYYTYVWIQSDGVIKVNNEHGYEYVVDPNTGKLSDRMCESPKVYVPFVDAGLINLDRPLVQLMLSEDERLVVYDVHLDRLKYRNRPLPGQGHDKIIRNVFRRQGEQGRLIWQIEDLADLFPAGTFFTYIHTHDYNISTLHTSSGHTVAVDMNTGHAWMLR